MTVSAAQKASSIRSARELGTAQIWPTHGPQAQPRSANRSLAARAGDARSESPALTCGNVWQVLGSNQRRLSRRFYSPSLLPEAHAADQHIRRSRRDSGRCRPLCVRASGAGRRGTHGRARTAGAGAVCRPSVGAVCRPFYSGPVMLRVSVMGWLAASAAWAYLATKLSCADIDTLGFRSPPAHGMPLPHAGSGRRGRRPPRMLSALPGRRRPGFMTMSPERVDLFRMVDPLDPGQVRALRAVVQQLLRPGMGPGTGETTGPRAGVAAGRRAGLGLLLHRPVKRRSEQIMREEFARRADVIADTGPLVAMRPCQQPAN